MASNNPQSGSRFRVTRPIEHVGASVLRLLDHAGHSVNLALDAAVWLGRGMRPDRAGRGGAAIVSQLIRVGVRSIFIVSLVSGVWG